MVPVMIVTVLAFSACLVWAEPKWKIALRLSLTFVGSYSVCSARAAKPHANTMAASATPNKRRMLSPKPVKEKSICQLSEPALGVGRTELRGLLVPGAGLRGFRNNVAHVGGAEHVGIVGLRQEQRGVHVLRLGGALKQQPRGRKVAGIQKALGALHQRRKLVRIHARNGGRGGRRRRDDRNGRYGGERRRGRLRRCHRCGCAALQRGLIGR